MINKNFLYDSKYEELFDYLESLHTFVKLQNQKWDMKVWQSVKDPILPFDDGATPIGFNATYKNNLTNTFIFIKIRNDEKSSLTLYIPREREFTWKQSFTIQSLQLEGKIPEFDYDIHYIEEEDRFSHKLRFKFSKENDVELIREIINNYNDILFG